jgi:hypothetical protein
VYRPLVSELTRVGDDTAYVHLFIAQARPRVPGQTRLLIRSLKTGRALYDEPLPDVPGAEWTLTVAPDGVTWVVRSDGLVRRVELAARSGDS